MFVVGKNWKQLTYSSTGGTFMYQNSQTEKCYKYMQQLG